MYVYILGTFCCLRLPCSPSNGPCYIYLSLPVFLLLSAWSSYPSVRPHPFIRVIIWSSHWVWRLSANEPGVSSSKPFPGCSQSDMRSKQVEWASRAAEGKREETVCSTSELGNTGPFLHMPMTVRHYGFRYPKEKSFKSDSLVQSQKQ